MKAVRERIGPMLVQRPDREAQGDILRSTGARSGSPAKARQTCVSSPKASGTAPYGQLDIKAGN
ncbi:hypothetical protein GCM10009628_40190 [Paeniglutamicibacter kerguelensis]